MFPFRLFLCNFTLNNSNHVLSKSWQVRQKKTMYHCTEVWSTEFISKQPCQFFFVTFLFTSVQIQCPSLWTECAWYLHSLIFLLICLLPVNICFKLLITRTCDNSNFFRFSKKVQVIVLRCHDLLTTCTYGLLETIGILLWCLSYCLQKILMCLWVVQLNGFDYT